MANRPMRSVALASLLIPATLFAQARLTSPQQFFGHPIGADYQLPNYKKLVEYWKKLDAETDKMQLVDIGKTEEGRTQYMAIVSSPQNMRQLNKYRDIAKKLCLAEGISDAEARKLAKDGKAVVWIDGGLHATEVLGAQQLMETLWQMVSGTDEETQRILNDTIILFVHANPDGMDLVSDWYMQESDPTKRDTNIPRLYQKYIGHDNNRDFYAATQAETKNMNRVMYREWFPQIMYNHHQTGPRGTVMFAPPFRDPFNHHIDPQVMTGIEQVGSAMHHRFVMENKPGVTMRTGASYSTWWNGGLRTTAYYHNIIGILTETIGSPTPMRIPFVADRLTPKGNLIFPIQPQEWKFRQSVDYSVTANRAILDYASRYREPVLYGIYQMGRRQIELGSRDTWIDYPSRTENARGLEELRKPDLRAPRGYVIPGDQDDMFTAEKFVQALEHNGVKVERFRNGITINGKRYASNTILVPTAQAFRAHVLDMFEPQDHPNDFPAPGAPPTAPYDNAGYTLAYQMGVEFERILDPIKAEPSTGPGLPSMRERTRPAILIDGGTSWGAPLSTNAAYQLLNQKWGTSTAALFKTSGVPVLAPSVPTGAAEARTIRQPRIGLWDRYGGSMESGWTRWVFDQFGFKYNVVFPQELDAGNLNSKYDVLIFVEGAIPARLQPKRAASTEGIPAQFHSWLGTVNESTLPKLKEFLENGGTVITIGSSTSLGRHLGLPIESHLMKDGQALPRAEYYVPGSVLQVKVDNSRPAAWGMKERADIMFDNAPVFKITGPGVTPIAWFDSATPLRSGWAWGQKYLKDGVAYAEAKIGKGTLYLYGPDVNFRGQSHGTFKLLFNPIILSRAEPATP